MKAQMEPRQRSGSDLWKGVCKSPVDVLALFGVLLRSNDLVNLLRFW